MNLRQIRPKPPRLCIFCPNPATTKEHAWEDWAIQRIQTAPSVITGHIEGQPLEVPLQKAIRIKCLCHDCNTKWLKSIVDATVPFLSAMVQDISITLDTPQQFMIAQWAMTRAMVWEYCSTENRPIFYSDKQRAALKQQGLIAANTSIWLAQYGGSTNLSAWVSDYTKPYRMHATTVAYKHLVVQILSIRPDQSVEPGAVVKPKPGPWPAVTARIFPTTAFTSWPPIMSLGIRGHPIDRFIDRWDWHPPGEKIPL